MTDWEHGERESDKARCKSPALKFLQTPPLLLVEFAVPFGFEEPSANPEFRQRVTDGARTRDLL
jgi:hypothetical protein